MNTEYGLRTKIRDTRFDVKSFLANHNMTEETMHGDVKEKYTKLVKYLSNLEKRYSILYNKSL